MKLAVLVYLRRITTAEGLCSVNIAGAAGNSHFLLLCTVQRPLMFARPMN